MSLIPVDGNVQFVQSTTPSSPGHGDVWVDTSLTPPQTKIYDGGSASFIQPRELSNLDAPVSGAGATQSDIETGIDNSTTGSRVDTAVSSRSSHTDPDPSGFIDEPISNAGKGADWPSYATQEERISFSGSGPESVTYTGEGYLKFIVTEGRSTGGPELTLITSSNGTEDVSIYNMPLFNASTSETSPWAWSPNLYFGDECQIEISNQLQNDYVNVYACVVLV